MLDRVRHDLPGSAFRDAPGVRLTNEMLGPDLGDLELAAHRQADARCARNEGRCRRDVVDRCESNDSDFVDDREVLSVQVSVAERDGHDHLGEEPLEFGRRVG